MKILLVDDSNTMRRIRKNTLEKLGYCEVHEACDGADAIQKLGTGGFGLVLMDWNMPSMTGIETLKAIKSNPDIKSVPVIVVTSESEKSRIVEAIHAGAANYLVKPFQPDALREKISAVAGKTA
jgi:two-component system, chemotaxis family, chemotaxis protein CheY